MLWLLGGSRRLLAGLAAAGAAGAPLAGAARIVGFNETWVKASGSAGRPAGIVVDLDRRRLELALTGPGFDCHRWLRDQANQLGVEVVVTDDSGDYAGPVAAAGLQRPRCMAPRKRALGQWESAGPPIAGNGTGTC